MNYIVDKNKETSSQFETFVILDLKLKKKIKQNIKKFIKNSITE